jgi:hypothetical protein
MYFGVFALGTWKASDLLQVYLNGNAAIIVFSQTMFLANKTSSSSPPYACAAAKEQFYSLTFPD